MNAETYLYATEVISPSYVSHLPKSKPFLRRQRSFILVLICIRAVYVYL